MKPLLSKTAHHVANFPNNSFTRVFFFFHIKNMNFGFIILLSQ